jgi:hypothetical protein
VSAAHSDHSYGVANDCANGSSNIGDGKEFTDRLFGLRKRVATGKQGFDTLCTEPGIDHRLTPPQSPQTNGMVERFNGRIEDVLQSHHFQAREAFNATKRHYVLFYKEQLPQSVFQSRTPLQAMKNWHNLIPELFKKILTTSRDVTHILWRNIVGLRASSVRPVAPAGAGR